MKKKLLIFVLTFLVIYCVNFFIPRWMPGDPFTYMAEGDDVGVFSSVTPEEMAELKAYYGLDKPLWQQFLDTVRSNLHGDFGYSFFYRARVTDILRDKLPWTMYIMLSSLVVSMLAGVVLAMATMKHRYADGLLFRIMSVLSDIPAYLVGVLLLFTVAARVSAIPLSGNVTLFKTFESTGAYLKDVLLHSLLPVSAMVLISTPKFYFTARSSFLTILQKKYVLNARAKGLTPRRIQLQYVLRNGVFPIVTCFFLSVGNSIGGTILVENVFMYPGLGKMLREAVKYRDYLMIQGIFLVSTFLVLLSSLAADLINQAADRGKAS